MLPILSIPKKILYFLKYESNGQQSWFFGDLTTHFNRAPSQISQTIKRLEEEGYITKERVGRQKKIVLTDAGSLHIYLYFIFQAAIK